MKKPQMTIRYWPSTHYILTIEVYIHRLDLKIQNYSNQTICSKARISCR